MSLKVLEKWREAFITYILHANMKITCYMYLNFKLEKLTVDLMFCLSDTAHLLVIVVCEPLLSQSPTQTPAIF